MGESGPADPELVAFADFTQEGGAAAMRALLSRRPDVDAVAVAACFEGLLLHNIARHDPTDPRPVVARIERVPATAEIDFEPGAEIHRRRIRRHADVTEIAGAIARRNVHAAAERRREGGIVPAYSGALGVGFPRRFGASREVISEIYVAMDELNDRLHSRPAPISRAK